MVVEDWQEYHRVELTMPIILRKGIGAVLALSEDGTVEAYNLAVAGL